MKIVDLKVFLVNEGVRSIYGSGWLPNYVFVKLYTDEGIEGLGEAFRTGKDKTTEAALHEYKRWLIGKDPTEIIRHWYAYYRGSRYPLGTATMAALSSVEQALWDISGKACGLPVYRMLGGPFRNRIRLYASNTLCQLSANTGSGAPLVQGVKSAVEQGFTAVKFIPQPDDFESKSRREVLEESVDRVRSVREGVGHELDICLDYHGMSFCPTDAIEFARAIEPYRPLFLEEPALTENPDSLHEVKLKTSIPIAGGERCISRDRLREVLEKRALHILQPEPTCNGGILETVKWAAMAELYHVLMAPHHAGSPVALLACCHIDACIPNFLIQECNADLGNRMFQDIFAELPHVEHGHLVLHDRPGLGIELNEESITKYPYKPFDRRVIVEKDGGIGLI